MPEAPWPVSGGQNCIGDQSPAVDIRTQLVTTKLVMEAGRGDQQGRESGEDTVRLMDQVGERCPSCLVWMTRWTVIPFPE